MKGQSIIRAAVREMLLSPLYALYGALRALALAAGAAGSLSASRRALAQALTCANCGERNSTADRWSCRSCHGVALGNAALCKCGATYSHFPCRRCGVSIWMDRS